MMAPLLHFLCIRHTKIKRPDIDVTENWGLAEEGRRKKGERSLITGGFFYNFFSHSHFKDGEKEKDTHRERERESFSMNFA